VELFDTSDYYGASSATPGGPVAGFGHNEELLRRHITALAPSAARELVSLAVVCTAGLWPFAHPSAAVAEAQLDPEPADTKVDFADRLGRTLHIAVTGLLSLQ
jgi:tetracycline repressor-like protein